MNLEAMQARLRKRLHTDDARARADAARLAAERTQVDARAAGERRERNNQNLEDMQERQRTALRGY